MVSWERKDGSVRDAPPSFDGPLGEKDLAQLARMGTAPLLACVDASVTKIGQLSDSYRRSGEAGYAKEAQKEALGLAQALGVLLGLPGLP